MSVIMAAHSSAKSESHKRVSYCENAYGGREKNHVAFHMLNGAMRRGRKIDLNIDLEETIPTPAQTQMVKCNQPRLTIFRFIYHSSHK